MGVRVGIFIALLAAVLAFGWFVVRPGAHDDFATYQEAAYALAEGEDPYSVPVPDDGQNYVYAPLLGVLLTPIAAWDPADAAFLFYLLCAAALLASLWLLARLPFGGAGGVLGWRAVLVGGALCAAFAYNALARGHVAPLLLLTQVGALALLVRRHYVLGGLFLALGATLRLTPLIPAGAVAIGLAAGARHLGWRPLVTYSSGLVVGLALFVFLVPGILLGSQRMGEVNERWMEVTYEVYVLQLDPQQLRRDYNIDEFQFRNQAPRRVLASWLGKLGGATFENSLPTMQKRSWQAVNVLARCIGLAVLITIAVLAWFRMNSPVVSQFIATFALAVYASVLVTRFTWPAHFVLAVPIVSVAAWLALQRERPARRALVYFLAGTALFYAAYAEPLRIVGGAGPLLIASVLVVVMATRALFRRPAEPDAPQGTAP